MATPIVREVQEPTKPKDTPSIFGRRKDKVIEEDIPNPVKDKQSNDFTEELLQAAWKKFGQETNRKGDTDRLVLNRKVKKGKESKVVITLASQLENSFLEKLEVELVQFLRAELKNDHIVLQREMIQEEEDAKRLYTSKDIYEHMVKQNPKLKDLKDRLGLDFDY